MNVSRTFSSDNSATGGTHTIHPSSLSSCEARGGDGAIVRTCENEQSDSSCPSTMRCNFNLFQYSPMPPCQVFKQRVVLQVVHATLRVDITQYPLACREQCRRSDPSPTEPAARQTPLSSFPDRDPER